MTASLQVRAQLRCVWVEWLQLVWCTPHFGVSGGRTLRTRMGVTHIHVRGHTMHCVEGASPGCGRSSRIIAPLACRIGASPAIRIVWALALRAMMTAVACVCRWVPGMAVVCGQGGWSSRLRLWDIQGESRPTREGENELAGQCAGVFLLRESCCGVPAVWIIPGRERQASWPSRLNDAQTCKRGRCPPDEDS